MQITVCLSPSARGWASEAWTGGDQVDQVGEHAGGDERNRGNPSASQSGFQGEHLKQVDIAEDIRPADVVGLPGGFFMFQAAGQVTEHVSDTDRLHQVFDLPGDEHDGQSLQEVAHDFKGSTARTEYHGGPQDGGRNRSRGQNAAHFGSRGQVRTQRSVGGHDAAPGR